MPAEGFGCMKDLHVLWRAYKGLQLDQFLDVYGTYISVHVAIRMSSGFLLGGARARRSLQEVAAIGLC